LCVLCVLRVFHLLRVLCMCSNVKKQNNEQAAAGWPVSELLDRGIASSLGWTALVDADDRVPSPLLDGNGLDQVSPAWWGFCLGLTASIDLYGVRRARRYTVMMGTTSSDDDDNAEQTDNDGVPKDRYLPGDLGFDPLKLFPATEGPNRDRMRLMEVQHGRAAMIAIVVFSIQEAITGIGVIDETPIFFRPPFFGS